MIINFIFYMVLKGNTNMKTPKLIVIEGACDGIGKSTQFTLLKERLSSLGITTASHHFPSYGTAQGTPVESYLKGCYGSAAELSPYLVNSLYAVDRAITWHSELKSEAKDGKLILLDRYTTSSLIYQSAFIKDEKDKADFIDYVTDFEYRRLGIPAPSAVIFLDAPYEAAAALRQAREHNDGVEKDIHETDDGFMRLVYNSAQFVADRLGWVKISSVDENGDMRPREDIADEIFRAVEAVL